MRFLFIVFFLFLLCFNNTLSSYGTQCLPTCSAVDGRFLVISGTGFSTIVAAEITINLVSRGDNLEFGIFDGEAGENWDAVPGPPSRLHVKYELYADPAGDTSGLAGPLTASWSGDGSSGLNVATPMNNNDWTDFTFPNVPGAQAPNGDFIYTLLITPVDPSMLISAQNFFKVRAQEELYIPAMVPITFIASFTGETAEFILEDVLILYPSATMDGESFCGLTELCDLNDPSCCFFETTYDGMWSFFMEVPPGESALDIWDGEFDYGDFAGTVFDTDDPNTPGDPFLPEWSIGTDVVFETARSANPNDNSGDSSEVLFVRDPSIQYLVIDPLGNQYQNFNPSADREWELFRLDTTTDDPAIAEFRVDSIVPGLWEVKLIGVDLSNLNSILLPFDLRGEQVDDPGIPRPIPTLNEWGLIILAMFIGIAGLMAIRRRKVTA